MTLIRSKAPLRLGLAGGGTDVSPYSDLYGGFVLNATVDLYAHCTLEFTEGMQEVEFHALDLEDSFRGVLATEYPLTGSMIIHKAVYNRVVREFNNSRPLPLRVTTWADAPPGSGLGTSSTLVVTILAAFQELLSLPLGEYDLAHMAFEIERFDCGFAGGKQDQYAATFGGFNFMEFYEKERVIVNPLRIRRHIENELQSSLLLFFTGRSRESARIINDQVQSIKTDSGNDDGAIAAMHMVKQLALDMKERILKGDIFGVQELLRRSWEAKKRMAASISNYEIEHLAGLAITAGANAVKISGAGGGGFLMIFVDPLQRFNVINALSGYSGQFHRFQFTHQGVEAWTVK